jgi:putative tricarboxylic transport membrane protein
MVDQASVPDPQPPTTERGPLEPVPFWLRWAEMPMAIGVLALGIVVLVESLDIKVRQGVVVNPRVFPQIVGAGLVVVAIWYAIDIVRSPRIGGGEDAEDVDPEARTDWTVLGILAIALIAYAALIDTAGFIIASTVLFVISTFAMHSRAYLRNLAIGVLLSVAVYLLFDGWLDVRLPGGWLEGVF